MDPSGVAWWEPYEGLPGYLVGLMAALLALAALSLVWALVLMSTAAREGRRQRRRLAQAGPRGTPGALATEADFVWVFLVPALDEEVTIADAVTRLAHVRVTRRAIVVIDDGSTDGTPEVLASLDVPDLVVLRRDLPDAQHGKAAALDAAWAALDERVLVRFPGVTRDDVVVVVVDADGRLGPDAPALVAPWFADPRMGGVQSLVRIYNRSGFLTWSQHLEFSVFGHVFQLGRSWWGTANMGGNGQFNRLSALDDVATDDAAPEGVVRGPWRDRLTEDQDLGVRLLQAGWAGRQSTRATVDQQGVPNLRRLYRQRVRWAQGAWQCLPLLRGTVRTRGGIVARVDAAAYLLIPLVQLVVGAGVVLTLALAGISGASLVPRWWVLVVVFVVLALGPGPLTLFGRGGGARGVLRALVAFVPYVLYVWLLAPVVAIALVRELRGATSWAKTAREPLAIEGVPETG